MSDSVRTLSQHQSVSFNHLHAPVTFTSRLSLHSPRLLSCSSPPGEAPQSENLSFKTREQTEPVNISQRLVRAEQRMMGRTQQLHQLVFIISVFPPTVSSHQAVGLKHQPPLPASIYPSPRRVGLVWWLKEHSSGFHL